MINNKIQNARLLLVSKKQPGVIWFVAVGIDRNLLSNRVFSLSLSLSLSNK